MAERILRFLSRVRPSALVGAAASGADLLVLEAALSLPRPPRVEIVLPTPQHVFREVSVEPAWRDRFDRVIERVDMTGRVRGGSRTDGEEAYRAGNAHILEVAERLAPGERVVVLAVASPDEGQMVEDLIDRGGLRGMPHRRIDPAIALSDRPFCFVVMPYGIKRDSDQNIEINCDQTYDRLLVPALEHAQLAYRRADETIDSGLVLEPMIDDIARADLVIADLATGNFNVGWELGLRHLLRLTATLLISPRGSRIPFDVQPLRHVTYTHAGSGIDDESAIAAWQALDPYLAPEAFTRHRDSLVDQIMRVEAFARVRPRSNRISRRHELLSAIALARDTGDVGRVEGTIATAAGLPQQDRVAVSAEGGILLVRMGAFRQARDALAPVVKQDQDIRHPLAHQFYAQAIYRDQPDADALAEAERVLLELAARHPYPETRALLGGVAKRRAGLMRERSAQLAELEISLVNYREEYEADLNAYYPGVNMLAVSTVLQLVHGDVKAGARARQLLPAVRAAADVALRRNKRDFWASATRAETQLHAALLGIEGANMERAAEEYRAAGLLRPLKGDAQSVVDQLDWLERIGIGANVLAAVRESFMVTAGFSAPAASSVPGP